MGESCRDENKNDICDEVKISLSEASHDEILFDKLDGSAGVLKDTLLREEEEIIHEFLSSLKLDYLIHDDLGIHSN